METCISQIHPSSSRERERERERETERMCTQCFSPLEEKNKLWQYNSLSVRKDLRTKCQNDINEKGSLAFLQRTNIFLLIPMKTPDTTSSQSVFTSPCYVTCLSPNSHALQGSQSSTNSLR